MHLLKIVKHLDSSGTCKFKHLWDRFSPQSEWYHFCSHSELNMETLLVKDGIILWSNYGTWGVYSRGSKIQDNGISASVFAVILLVIHKKQKQGFPWKDESMDMSSITFNCLSVNKLPKDNNCIRCPVESENLNTTWFSMGEVEQLFWVLARYPKVS